MIGREMGRVSRAHFNVIPFHLETRQLGECSELLQASFSLNLVLEVRVFCNSEMALIGSESFL